MSGQRREESGRRPCHRQLVIASAVIGTCSATLQELVLTEGYPETPSRLLSWNPPKKWVRLGLALPQAPFAPALVPAQVEGEDGAWGLGGRPKPQPGLQPSLWSLFPNSHMSAAGMRNIQNLRNILPSVHMAPPTGSWLTERGIALIAIQNNSAQLLSGNQNNHFEDAWLKQTKQNTLVVLD